MKKFLITSAVALLLVAVSRWASHNLMFTASAACTVAILALVVYMAVRLENVVHSCCCVHNVPPFYSRDCYKCNSNKSFVTNV